MMTPLRGIVDKYMKWRLKTSPEYATGVDVHEFNHLLESQCVEAYDKRYHTCQDLLKSLNDTVEPHNLDKNDLFVYKLLVTDLEVLINGYQWRHYSTYNAVNFLETIPIDFMSYLIDTTPFQNADDFDKYIARLGCIPRQIGDQMQLMGEAIKNGTTLHSCTMKRAVQHFEKQLATPVENSVFYEPIMKKLPLLEALSDNERDKITSKIVYCIEKQIYPSLESLLDFISREYMPHCRSSFGVSCLPKGEDYYKACLEWHTTSSLTPLEVHNLGKKEVLRISKNMKAIMKEVRFEGTIKQFVSHLQKQEEFFHKEPKKMLQEFEDIIGNIISPKLQDFFSDIPNVKCEIREMPFDGPGGMYYPASADGKRPGTFFVQLEHLSTFPRYTMMSLALHEAIPGHHFQHIVAHAKALPKFHCERDYRKLLSAPFLFPINTAYVEGWALYAEYLGEEMGVYSTPYDMFGRYSDEMFRAARLVVDTGLHVLDWSRDEAIVYMSELCAIPEGEIHEEVDRYMTWPGQACAYKIGELKIKELRQIATERLGDMFDIIEFHNVILSVGPVSLGMLEEAVMEWIDDKTTY